MIEYKCSKCKETIEIKDFVGEYNICRGCASNIIYETIDENYIQVEHDQKVFRVSRFRSVAR